MQIKRQMAKKFGMARYETGKACIRGHKTERYTSTGQCVECVRELNSEAYAVKVRKSLGAPFKITVAAVNEAHAAYLRQHAEESRANFMPKPDPYEKVRLLLDHVPVEHLRMMGYEIPPDLLAVAPATRLAAIEAQNDARRDAMQHGEE